MTELTETKARSFYMTLHVFIGRILMGISTYIILLMDNLSLNPLIFILITSILALISSIVLPDTFGWKIEN